MDKIAILDFGGQYTHLIANRIRRLNVFSEIKRSNTPVFYLKNYKGIIMSGGPKSVYDHDAPKCDRRIFDLGVPILSICYGHQLMAKLLGGDVQSGKVKEYGHSEIEIKKPGMESIFKEMDRHQDVWMSHGDEIVKLPLGFEILASSKDCEFAAIGDLRRNFYGVQFHPEVTHTSYGKWILNNFLDICKVERNWSLDDFISQKIEVVKNFVGKRKVFVLVSGGVDSTVTYVLLVKALGEDRVHGLFVDTGFLRQNERTEVENALRTIGVKNLHVYDAKKDFFDSLKDVYDPEVKRAVIGNLFLEIKDKAARQLGLNLDDWLLGQGTIYPDTIETGGSQHADKIKTHHNRVDKIQELIQRKRLIEPLRNLYKDEVREVGEKLGIEKSLIWRHPFPGPGLAVRILCAKEPILPKNHLELERQINIMLSESEMKGKVLPIKSVGVQGDARTYKYPLVIWGDTDFEKLRKISTMVTNQFNEINRVVYAFGAGDIENIKFKPGYLTEDRVTLLQKADKIVGNILAEKDVYKDFWQFPVVLLPISVNNQGKESIVLRPVCSQEAMTANFGELDWMIVKTIVDDLQNISEISCVLYDVTNKPPGTIEWE